MHVRPLSTSLLLCLTGALIGCAATQGLDSVAVSPTSQSLAVGQTLQFTATGTFGNARHPSTQDVTKAVTWASTVPSVATVNAAGLATAVSPGTTTITASATAFNGPISSSAILTVSGSTSTGGGSGGTGSTGSTGSGADIVSLTIIPSGMDLAGIKYDGQFLAIGTFKTPPLIRDVTNQVTWFTSQPNKFPVTNNVASGAPGAGTQNGGIVTAYEASQGPIGATITAELVDKTGSIGVATATVGCSYVAPDPTATPPKLGHCDQLVPQLLSTLTVYNEGLNTTDWDLSAPSATGTPSVIHCGPKYATNGGSVCTATYPLGTSVTITAKGTNFGGWSSNCTNPSPPNFIFPNPSTSTGPNTCTINLGITDAAVGAVFN